MAAKVWRKEVERSLDYYKFVILRDQVPLVLLQFPGEEDKAAEINLRSFSIFGQMRSVGRETHWWRIVRLAWALFCRRQSVKRGEMNLSRIIYLINALIMSYLQKSLSFAEWKFQYAVHDGS